MVVVEMPLPEGQDARLGMLFERLAELQGQRNVIDARIVEVVQELEAVWHLTGCRSLEQCVAWKTGSSSSHARSLVKVAERAEELPRCVGGLAEGSLSLDQVAVIAERAADGSDSHYAELAESATVAQLRKALSLAPRPEPDPRPVPERSVTKLTDEECAYWRIKLPHVDAAVFDAALQSHLDALVAEWRRDHGERDKASEDAPPFPTVAEAFMRLVEAGWDSDVVARPHGHRTTVVMHVDAASKLASLHLGPALSEAERRYLGCDATVETWFEKDGVAIGCGRETRQIPRRLRRALEHRHPTCAVPGCGSSRGLHAHHIRHWEDGGPTELSNLVLICAFHHRQHHRGVITIRGPGHAVTVLDRDGEELHGGSLARPPRGSPPNAPPYAGSTGERCDWYWYEPFEPKPGAESIES
jgi:hypothetical protein